eukprot:SAG31_NODE_13122_length_891_cov_1.193182_1_plen_162_part_00
MKPASHGPCGDAGASIDSKAGAKLCATVSGLLSHSSSAAFDMVPQGFCLAFEAADEDQCAAARVTILSVAKVYKQGAIFEVSTFVWPPLRFFCSAHLSSFPTGHAVRAGVQRCGERLGPLPKDTGSVFRHNCRAQRSSLASPTCAVGPSDAAARLGWAATA